MPLLLVVSGLPATGKTALSRELARELRWPHVSKDDFMESVFDAAPTLPKSVLGPLGFTLMYRAAEIILVAGGSLILETHFHLGVSEPRILALAEAHGARVLQVFCHAPLSVLVGRDRERISSGEKHRLHTGMDYDRLPLTAGCEPLALGAPLLPLDTADFECINIPNVVAWVRGALQ